MTIAIVRAGLGKVALIDEGESALFRPAPAPRAWSLPWTRQGLFGVRRMHSRGKRYYFVLGERADPDDAL